MKNAIRLVAAAALAAVMSLFMMGSAHAYPDPVITITAPEEVVGGQDLNFSASAGDVPCDAWTVTFAGGTVSGAGTDVSGSFATDPVTAAVDETLTASCEYLGDDDDAAAAADVAAASVTVSIVPAGSGGSGSGDGVLPNTGTDASLWMLAAAGALVLVGGGAVLMNRRESDI